MSAQTAGIKTIHTSVFCVLILLFSAAAPLGAQSLKNTPKSDPVYLFLDKAYAKNWIGYLPAARPYTEKKIYFYLREILSSYKSNPESLSSFEEEELLSHIKRFEGNSFSLYKKEAENFTVEFGLAPYTDFNMNLNSPSDSATVLGTDLALDLTAGENLYMGFLTDQYLILETGNDPPYRKFNTPYKPDFNTYTYNLSTGSEGFNNNAVRSTGDTEFSIRMNQLNQMTVDLGLSTLTFGRDALSWGESRFSNLALSDTSKPYEYFSFDIPFGERIYFIWMTGFLKDWTDLRSEVDGSKIITAHRFEWQLTDWFMFSIYESVVYSERFELAYLNPFSIYYISEVTQGDYDNKLGGIDLVFRIPSSMIYFSLFADDWDFGELFSPSYYHNEMGITLGIRHYDLIPGLTLTAEYSHLNQWMYTHKEINGERNNYTHYGSHLGHLLEPNSHIIFLDFRYDYSIKNTCGLSLWFTQDSYGDVSTHPSNDGIGWDMEGKYDPWDGFYNYLDYGIDGITRETNYDLTFYTEYRIPYYGVRLYAGWSVEYTHNKNRIKGDNEWANYLSLSAKWQAY
ncbi:MAG: capsule assembly Wzi family protein [Spirochaetia bacterium]|nr:capsule assembly Wzi family protein [Spirochaetia bacterium]